MIKLINSDKSIKVSENFFIRSKLLQNWEDDELVLTEDYYDEEIIKCIDEFKYDCDSLKLSKIICLMHMLDMEYENIIKKLDDIDLDKKFVENYKLVQCLWNNSSEERQIQLMKLPLNFVNISFKSKNVTQYHFDNCSDEFKNGLIKLDIENNEKINNVNMFINLEELGAGCGINQNGISKLKNLKILYADNYKITNVNHLQFLEELHASGECGIDQNGISQLKNLKILNVWYNYKINDINHLQLLENLEAVECGITQYGISKLKNLKKLNACSNKNINDVSHLQLLESLNAGQGCEIDQQNISQLKNLKWIRGVKNMTNIDHLKY